MTTDEKRFRARSKELGISLESGEIIASDVARICDLNASTVHRAVLRGDLPARRRVPRGRMLVSVESAIAFFVGDTAARA